MIKITLGDFSEVELLNYCELAKNQSLEVLQMRNHPDVRKWMFNENEILEEEHTAFIRTLATCSTKLYFLVMQGKQLIGVINFTNISESDSSSELGVFANLTNPKKGKGSILLNSSIEYSRKYLHLDTLYLEVFVHNQRAINLYERFGFVKAGSGKHNNDVVKMTLKCC